MRGKKMRGEVMGKTRLLVIDDNETLVNMIKDYFAKTPNIEVSLTAKDGNEGILFIDNKKEEYDLIILDLIMPYKDGISVLEYINNNRIDKKVIVETSYNTPEIIHKVAILGAYYLLVKPFELQELEKKVLETINSNEHIGGTIDLIHNNLQVFITKTLHELGVPSHIKGYQYIREGIILVYENNVTIGITKEIYPVIAKKYDSTVPNVERAIRHAIEVSWNRGNWDLMEDIFGNSIDIDKAKPTNSEFIITIADKLRLEFSKPLLAN